MSVADLITLDLSLYREVFVNGVNKLVDNDLII
jgi:hypothetical protein